MTGLLVRTVVPLALCLLIGCSGKDDNNPVFPAEESVIGNWVAVASTAESDRGFLEGVIMIVMADGTFTQSLQGDGYEYATSGKWEVADGTFTAIYDPIDNVTVTFTGSYSIVDNRLILC